MTRAYPNARSTVATRKAVLAIAAAIAALNASADSASWSPTPVDGDWSNVANWTGGIAVGNTTQSATTDVATFGAASSTTTLTIDAGRTIGGITFNTTGSAFTIGATAGNTLYLSSGGLIQSTASSGSQTINAPLQILGDNATYTIRTNTPGTSRTLTIGGAISGASTAGNTTVLTLDSTSSTVNAINGTVSDGTNGGKLAIVKTGSGQMSLAAGTFTGGITVQGGTLRTGTSGNSTAAFGTGAITLDGGGLLLGSTSASNLNNALNVVGAGFVNFRGNHTFNPTALTGTGTLTISNTSSTGATITTSSLQDYAGTLVINPNGSQPTYFRLASAYSQTSMQNTALVLNSTTFLNQQAGTNNTVTTKIGSISGSGTIGGSAAGAGTFVYEVGGRGDSTVFSGLIVDGGTKSALTKAGVGTLTLSGANTYTGATAVAAGTLQVDGSIAAGAVSVASGATLTGTGTIGGATTVLGNLGSTGVLKFSNSLTLDSASATFLDIDGTTRGTSFDGVNVAGTLSYGGALTLDFGSAFLTGTESFQLFAAADGTSSPLLGSTSFSSINLVGSYTTALSNLSGTWTGSAGGYDFTFQETTGLFAVSVVPEPATYGMLAGLLALGAAAWRRRRS